MKALKFIINGEEHEIEGSGSAELPGICYMTISLISGHLGRAEIDVGEIVDGTIVIMDNSSGVYITEVDINGKTYKAKGRIDRSCDVTGIVREVGGNRFIFTMDREAHFT